TKKEYRIAIVDDEGDLLTLFTEALKTAGLNVIGYTDPIQILDVFESNPNSYDMLITDIRMPNMNGFQLVKRILELNED
ncbi:MAG TPA: response regulator, partial [Nitrososphaeraceae archaeon]